MKVDLEGLEVGLPEAGRPVRHLGALRRPVDREKSSLTTYWLTDSYIIQLKEHGPSRTCNESTEEEEELTGPNPPYYRDD